MNKRMNEILSFPLIDFLFSLSRLIRVLFFLVDFLITTNMNKRIEYRNCPINHIKL